MSPDSHTGTDSPTPQRKTPWSFLLLVGSFIVPVVFAYALLHSGLWAQRGTANNGVLIDPPVDFDQLTLTTADNQVYQRSAEGNTKWWIVYIVPPACDKPCQATLYQIHQTYLATGAERHRVGTLTITTQPPSTDLTALFAQHDTQASLHLQGDETELNDILQSASLGEQPINTGRQIFLVDPMGAVFMTYPAPQNEQQAIQQGKLMLKDLKRVLKLSRIG